MPCPVRLRYRTGRGSSSVTCPSSNPRHSPVNRACSSTSSGGCSSQTYSSSCTSNDVKPATRGCDDEVTCTVYGAIGGWARNCPPSTSANRPSTRGVRYTPPPTAGGSIAECVPCSASHRPPRSTNDASSSASETDGRTSQV